MKRKLITLVLAALMTGLLALPAVGQGAFGTVKGVAKDAEGNPIAGAQVQMVSVDTGRKYTLKTNDKGEFFSIGIAPAEKYNITLTKDGKVLDTVNNFPVQTGDNELNLDMKKDMQQAAQKQGINPEQLKKMQEQQAKQAKEVNTVKTLNEKLAAANAASEAGDYQTAIASLTEATQVDPTRGLLWFKLGDAYRNSATKQTDPAEKKKTLDQAIADYEKATTLKQEELDKETNKKPEDTKELAAYYNNLGEAYARAGNPDGASKAYNQAAQLNPTGAGQYYFNLGAVLTNANTSNDSKMRQAAVDAFDKAIAADPNKADAYYWKGSNLIGMATLEGDKMKAPDGTAEAFQKYLELQPTGPHAEEAKAMLTGLGSAVVTSYGKTGKKTTKKQ